MITFWNGLGCAFSSRTSSGPMMVNVFYDFPTVSDVYGRERVSDVCGRERVSDVGDDQEWASDVGDDQE